MATFTANVNRWDGGLVDYVQDEVQFFNVRTFEFKGEFLLIVKNNGDIHATKTNEIKSFTLVQDEAE